MRSAPMRRSWRDDRARLAGVIRPARASSRQRAPTPAARAIHSIVCRSRRPPGLSLMLGSRLYAASWCEVALLLLERLRLEERARVDRSRRTRVAKRAKSSRLPASSRVSSRLVRTVTSPRHFGRGIRRPCARCGRLRGRCPTARRGSARSTPAPASSARLGQQDQDVDVGVRVELRRDRSRRRRPAHSRAASRESRHTSRIARSTSRACSRSSRGVSGSCEERVAQRLAAGRRARCSSAPARRGRRGGGARRGARRRRVHRGAVGAGGAACRRTASAPRTRRR